jgi:hypothetical protein
MKRLDVQVQQELERSKRAKGEELKVEVEVEVEAEVESILPESESFRAQLGSEVVVLAEKVETDEYILEIRVAGEELPLCTLGIRPKADREVVLLLDLREREQAPVSAASVGLWAVLFAAKLRLGFVRRMIRLAMAPSTRYRRLQRSYGVAGEGQYKPCANEKCGALDWIDSESGRCLACETPPSLYMLVRQQADSLDHRGPEKSQIILPEQLLTKYLDNRGRCLYSDRPISFTRLSDWQVSAERLNSDLPYYPENIGLIARIFNVMEPSGSRPPGAPSNQWSREKFQMVKLLRSFELDLACLQAEIAKARTTPIVSDSPWFAIGLVNRNHCSVCKLMKPAEQFAQVWHSAQQRYALSGHCNACHSLAFFFADMFSGSTYDGTISVNRALDQLWAQRGRCVVSKLELCLQPYSHWQCTPRRKNEALPYGPDNFEFICAEFRIVTPTQHPNVSKRWSTELFNQVFFITPDQ